MYRFDVLTPADIVDVLVFYGGVKNTFVDYIELNRDNPDFNSYDIAGIKELLDAINNPSEIRYNKVGTAKYEMNSYNYSHCCYRKFLVQGFLFQ